MKLIKRLSRFPSAAPVIIFALLLGVSVFAFQNCGAGFQPSASDLSSMAAGSRLEQQVDLNCSSNSQFTGCVYDKVPSPDGSLSYSQIQTNIGINLDDLKVDGHMNLSTARYNVVSLNSLTAPATDEAPLDEATLLEQLRQPTKYKDQQAVEKLQALYWAERVNNFLKPHMAQPLEKVSIVVDAKDTGWSLEKRLILLGANRRGFPQALDGGIVVHLLGESLFSRASKGLVNELDLDQGKHTDCKYRNDEAIYEKECCSSSIGCSKAITAGLSDYLVSQIFPENPSVGDFGFARQDGAGICGLFRNPLLNKTLTADQAYMRCGSDGQPGHVYAMAVLLNSIWHEVGMNLKAKGLPITRMHHLFAALLPKIEPADTFVTLLEKIRQIDNDLYLAFQEEYQRRGLIGAAP